MAREVGELVSEDFEDRGVDFNSVDAFGTEIKRGKNITTAPHADDGDFGRRLHQIGGIDDVVLQVRQLADITIVTGDDRGRIRVDIEMLLIYFGRRRMGDAPAERRCLSKRRHSHARVSIPALEQRSHLLGPLGPEDAQMTLAGNFKSGVRNGYGRQGKRDGAAEAQAADVPAVPHHYPACTSSKGSDPQCRAHGIDDEQYENDSEASERRPCEVGSIKPSAAIRQAGQQKRDADATLSKRPYEGDRRDRQRHHHVLLGEHERHAEEDNHCANAGDREPRSVACEFHPYPFWSIAVRSVVDLHRSAGKSEHRK